MDGIVLVRVRVEVGGAERRTQHGRVDDETTDVRRERIVGGSPRRLMFVREDVVLSPDRVLSAYVRSCSWQRPNRSMCVRW